MIKVYTFEIMEFEDFKKHIVEKKELLDKNPSRDCNNCELYNYCGNNEHRTKEFLYRHYKKYLIELLEDYEALHKIIKIAIELELKLFETDIIKRSDKQCSTQNT